MSRRQAVLIVNVILECMIKALRCGEGVVFPFRRLIRERRHFNKYWDMVDDWPADRQEYTVEWELNLAGIRRLCREQQAGAPKRRRQPRRGLIRR